MRSYHSLVILAATVCLLLSGCDTLTSPRSNPFPQQQAAPSSEDTTTSTLSFRQWPEEAPLPSVSEWTRWKDHSGSARPSLKTSAASLPDGASPYGCLISTLDPEATPHPYRYDDLYVHYADSVATAAGDSTHTLSIVYGSKDLFAEQSLSEKIVVRVARCRIPGLDEARRPLMERLHQFNEKNKPIRPKAEAVAPSLSAFIASIEDSASLENKSGGVLRKNKEESCTEAIICVAGNCWQDSLFDCGSGGDSSGGHGSGGSGGYGGVGGGGNNRNEGGGGSAPPSDGDSGDGGESADPCDQTRTSICEGRNSRQRLQERVRENKFALIDNIPCGQISEWTNLATLNIPGEVESEVRHHDILGTSEVQRLEDAAGAVVNMDEFAVSMNVEDIPYGMNPKQFLRHIRSNLNDFTDDPDVIFNVESGSLTRQDPLGTIVSITLAQKWFLNVDEGSVVVSSASASHWTFTTIWTVWDGYHPVSGNRRFGFKRNGERVTFYTRGVDRMTTNIDRIANINNNAFEQADKLWRSFQKEIKKSAN